VESYELAADVQAPRPLDFLNPEEVWAMADDVADVISLASSACPGDEFADFSVQQGREVVASLRSHYDRLLQEADASLSALGKRCETRKYSSGFLLNCFLLADVLRNDADLRHAVSAAARVILPRTVAAKVCENLATGKFQVPSPKTISKARLTIDAAWTLHVREELRQLCCSGVVVFLMVDASPQGGRGYELMVFSLMARTSLVEAHETVKHLHALRHTSGTARSAALPDEVGVLEGLRGKFVRYTPPPVVLGSGAGTLAHKYGALAHAFHLLSSSGSDLQRLGNLDRLGICFHLQGRAQGHVVTG